jgi:hypothetical protein
VQYSIVTRMGVDSRGREAQGAQFRKVAAIRRTATRSARAPLSERCAASISFIAPLSAAARKRCAPAGDETVRAQAADSRI